MGRKKKEIELVFNPVFEPLFYDNLDDPFRYIQVYGGRGSGKSFAVAMAMVQRTYSPFKHKILYLRQTMTTSEDSTKADVKNAISILRAEDDFKDVKGVITNIRTGSTISFKGLKSSGNNSAKLKSLSGVTTLVIEEAEEIESFDEFSKVDESIRLKGKPLKVILIYNPGQAMNSWIHKEWFIEGQPNPERFKDTIYLHSTYLDNLENLNESTIARYESLKQTNPIYYQNTILAEWTLDAENRIYAGWEMYDSFDNYDEADVWYGLDFGYGGNDSTALIKIAYFEGYYYISEVFAEEKMSIRRTLTAMRRNHVPFNALIFADSAVPELIDQIRKGGYRSIRKAFKGNKEAGIKRIQDKNIILIGDDRTKLYFAYKTFARKKDGTFPHEPDTLAALRYGINSRRPIDNSSKSKAAKRARAMRKRKSIGFLRN